MKLIEVLTIMQNRVLTLNEAKKLATTVGDLTRLNEIEADLLTTRTTIEQISRQLNEPIIE